MTIKLRLDQLGLGQRELAQATQVTESYISQLLTRKRLPPAPNRTDIYEKMDHFLKLPMGELAKLATLQRLEEIRSTLDEKLAPLIGDMRSLLLHKCNKKSQSAVRNVFQRHSFGDLELLVTKTVLELIKGVTQEHLKNETWLRTVAKLSQQNYQEMRVIALEFLDTDLLDLPSSSAPAFIEPILKSWDIDLTTFDLKIELHPKVTVRSVRYFGFAEQFPEEKRAEEPGFAAFLKDQSLSGSATPSELAFLGKLRLTSGRPNALYYYRALQNLRDPLHFQPVAERAKPLSATRQ